MAENPCVDEGAYVENVARLAGFRQEECVASSDLKRPSNEGAGQLICALRTD